MTMKMEIVAPVATVDLSKYRPVWGNCIVVPDDILETDETFKRAAAAGIALPEQEQKRHQQAQVEGVLVRVGGDCFTDWNGEKPKEGDRVVFNKHAGFVLKDAKHRVVVDTDIMIVIED